MSASDRTYYRSVAGSVAVDALTKQILTVANELLTLPKFGGESEPMTATQGSYRPKTSYSGSTHTGCAAVDLTAWNWQNRLHVLDLLGAVGFHRTRSQGPWIEHIHTATNGMGCAAASLKWQIGEAKQGQNGLRDGAPDPDKARRSGLWPLAVYQGRTGRLKSKQHTHLYDKPTYDSKVLTDVPKGMVVKALMEVNVAGKRWFVTDAGEWGYSGKWDAAP